MGNEISTTSETKKQIISDSSINENRMLIDKILNKSKELYDKNMTLFLDEDFCKKMFIAYSSNLYELPIKKSEIKNAYDQINSNNKSDKLQLIIKSDSLDDEKYLINQLSGKIVEHFKNNKFITSKMHEGIRLSFPEIQYVQKRVLGLLQKIQDIEKEKQQMTGGRFNKKNFH